MRNFVEAYAAVHNTEAKEELTSSRDCISEMNLSDLTDGDLDEIVEQVLEVMFSQGHTVDSAHEVFGEAFEESNISGRQYKIERLCEALNRAFDNIDSKASTVALEEFAKYRNNKKLQESWSARFNQEKRIQRAHDRLVAAESLNVKTQLLKLVEGTMDIKGFEIPKKEQDAAAKRVKEKTAQKMMKKEEVSQIRKGWGDAYRSIYEKNDGNLANNYPPYDKVTRGDVIAGATGKDQMGGKKKAKMKKEEVETIAERGPAVGGQRPPGRLAARRAELDRRAAAAAANQEVKKEEVEQVDELYKGKHGQTEKQYQDSRSDAGKMVSGDSKMSGAAYSSRSMKGTGPNPAGGSKKPEGQGRMTSGARTDLQFRKAAMKKEGVQFSEAELKAFEEIVNSWED